MTGKQTIIVSSAMRLAEAKAMVGRIQPVQPYYAVTIESYYRNRSLQQNARWWAVLTEISQKMPPHMDAEWLAPEVWHEYFCRRILGVHAVEMFGDVVPVRKSSSNLNKNDFGALMTQAEAFVAEHGISLEEVSNEKQN